MKSVKSIQPGLPRPLGATWTGRGVNFAVFSSHATRVELAIFDAAGGGEAARYDLPARTGGIWHGFLPSRKIAPGALYAFHAHGPQQPEAGLRFDPSLPLIDPYAKALSAAAPLRCSSAARSPFSLISRASTSSRTSSGQR